MILLASSFYRIRRSLETKTTTTPVHGLIMSYFEYCDTVLPWKYTVLDRLLPEVQHGKDWGVGMPPFSGSLWSTVYITRPSTGGWYINIIVFLSSCRRLHISSWWTVYEISFDAPRECATRRCSSLINLWRDAVFMAILLSPFWHERFLCMYQALMMCEHSSSEAMRPSSAETQICHLEWM